MRIAIAILLSLTASVASAETGMGLIVDRNTDTVRRIDLVDGQVAYTTPAFGTAAKHARFSPNGDAIVFSTKNSEVFVCELSGEDCWGFDVWTDNGTVSWTQSGIWVGDYGGARLYDATDGTELRRIFADWPNPNEVTIMTVSHDEKTAGARLTPPGNAGLIHLDDGSDANGYHVVDLGGGCSTGASPDGQLATHNLWETDVEHQTMKIHDRSGALVEHLWIYDVIPYDHGGDVQAFTWNSQSWSSNSNDIFLVPTGRGFPQMTGSVMPWIYNYTTKEAFCLHEDPYAWDIKWYIWDYYTGTVGPQPTPPAVDAGPDRNITVDTWTFLDATVNPDGLGPDEVTTAWTTVSGPADAEFDDPASVDTDVTFPATGDYVIRLTAVDDGQTSHDDLNIHVAEPGQPGITIHAPAEGDVLTTGDTVLIEFETIDVTDVTITFSDDGGSSWRPIAGSLDDSSADWGAYPWQVPETPASDCRIRIAGYFGEAPTESGAFAIALAGSDTAVAGVADDLTLVAVGCSSAPPGLLAALACVLLARRRRQPSS